MKSSGPKIEKETTINFNDAEPYAQIWTASDIIDRRCRKAGLTLTEAGERHNVYTCPKAFIKIRKKIQRTPMSEEKKAAWAKQMTSRRQST